MRCVALVVLCLAAPAFAQVSHVLVDHSQAATLADRLLKDATAKPKRGVCLPEPLDDARQGLGLLAGDCLRELSGLPVESAASLREAYKRLRGATRIYLAVERSGARSTLELEFADAAAIVAAQSPLDHDLRCSSATRCEIKRRFFDDLLADTSQLSRSLRIVPSTENSVVNGFKLFAIRPDSLVGRLGFLNGDLLKEINGVTLTSPDKALELYTQIKTAKLIKFGIVRRGVPTTIELAIVE